MRFLHAETSRQISLRTRLSKRAPRYGYVSVIVSRVGVGHGGGLFRLLHQVAPSSSRNPAPSLLFPRRGSLNCRLSALVAFRMVCAREGGRGAGEGFGGEGAAA